MLTKEDCFSQKNNSNWQAINTEDVHLMNAVNEAMDMYLRSAIKHYLMKEEHCSEVLAEYFSESFVHRLK